MRRFGGEPTHATHSTAREAIAHSILSKKRALEDEGNLLILHRFITRINFFEKTNQDEIFTLSMAALCFAKDAITDEKPSWMKVDTK
jgi:hypothetical protein